MQPVLYLSTTCASCVALLAQIRALRAEGRLQMRYISDPAAYRDLAAASNGRGGIATPTLVVGNEIIRGASPIAQYLAQQT